MKELQKYKCLAVAQEDPLILPARCMPTDVYLASEADAAFAEMRRHHAEVVDILEKRIANMREQAAFIDRKHAEEVSGLRKQVDDLLSAERALIADATRAKDEYKRDADMLIAKHAEEIERLKAEHMEDIAKQARRWEVVRLQAGRYEKLKMMSFPDLSLLCLKHRSGDGELDALVDQLPASGES